MSVIRSFTLTGKLFTMVITVTFIQEIRKKFDAEVREITGNTDVMYRLAYLYGAMNFLDALFGNGQDEAEGMNELLYWHIHHEPAVIGRIFELLPHELPVSADMQKMFASIHAYYKALESKDPNWEAIRSSFNEFNAETLAIAFFRSYYLLLTTLKMHPSEDQLDAIVSCLCSEIFDAGWRQTLLFCLINTQEAIRWYEADRHASYLAFNCALAGYKQVTKELKVDDPRMIGIVVNYWALIQQADTSYPLDVRSEPLACLPADKLWCTAHFPEICKIRK